jgi:microcin C transport system substrate-binding protein
LFFGQYERVDSYFYGTPLRWEGLPQGEELAILESVKDKIPAGVFNTEYKNPAAGDASKLRANLREALKLLGEAGYKLDGNRLVDANGEQLGFEILLNGPTIEPVAMSLQTNLANIGIAASIRSVDSPQYINRLRSRDFDMTYTGWGETLSPGNEQRDFWGSISASGEDSRNYAGIADPGIDALIDKVIYADDRETLIAATKALDRVLMAHDFVIPTYALRKSRIARWDRFSHPDPLPEYGVGFPTVWWWDAAKAAKVAGQ